MALAEEGSDDIRSALHRAKVSNHHSLKLLFVGKLTSTDAMVFQGVPNELTLRANICETLPSLSLM
jgi:hypothetical protein